MDLQRDPFWPGVDPVGPAFYRWMPDGRSDAIELPTKDKAAITRVWFERRGIVRDGWLYYDRKGKDFESGMMHRQVPVEAGHLIAESEFRSYSNELGSLLAECTEDGPPAECSDPEALSRFGKRVESTLLDAVGEFVDVLRFQFGQYWLRPMETWDSRSHSLGVHMRRFNAYWRLGSEGKNGPFVPTKKTHGPIKIVERSGEYTEFMTQDDWNHLRDVFSSDIRPTTGMRVLVDAYRFLSDGDEVRALIEAVTALELVLQETVARPYKPESKAAKRVASFGDRSTGGLSARVAAMAAVCPQADKLLVDECIAAIERRNEIVHKGVRKSDRKSISREVLSVINICRSFINDSRFKMPHATRHMYSNSAHEGDAY